MKPLEDIYKGSFFGRRNRLMWRVDPVCNAIYSVLKPASIIDVGCAIGDYVKGFTDRGVIAYGLEGSENARPFLVVPEERIFFEDLRMRVRIDMCFDLAMCFEVVEHIEPEYTKQLINNLVCLSPRVLVTAAALGEGGHYHVNCQPHEYWIEEFKGFGYKYIPRIVGLIQKEWESWKTKKEMSSYYKNLMYFEGELPC